MFKRKHKSNGFTLVELLLAMAIISIISGAVLISITSQRKKAHETKMLAELSGVAQPLLMCRTDGGTVASPDGTAGGGDICTVLLEATKYGKWPSTSGSTFGNYFADADFNDGEWHFYIDDGIRRICCNSGSAKCHDLASLTACTNVLP